VLQDYRKPTFTIVLEFFLADLEFEEGLVLFFLKNAGELRFIILRRKSGQEPVTTVHKLTALYGLYSRL
jgi:hypothetical protein